MNRMQIFVLSSGDVGAASLVVRDATRTAIVALRIAR